MSEQDRPTSQRDTSVKPIAPGLSRREFAAAAGSGLAGYVPLSHAQTGNTMNHPTTLGLQAAADAIERSETTSVQLVDALLGHIDKTEPRLQAWELVDRRGSLEAAERADTGQQQRPRSALHGVPVAVKDLIDVAGLPTTNGWRTGTTTAARADAVAVARLRAAGAIVLGKTVTTPYAAIDPPKTRNPWNLARTPGGSSAGSAAAVAAGHVAAALGTQTVGSVLRPAAYCGIVGLKPTYGRVNREGVFPMSWSLDHVGTLTRSVRDAVLMLNVIATPGAGPGGQAPEPFRIDPRPARPTIGFVVDLDELAGPAVRARHADIVRMCRDAGAEVREVRLAEPFAKVLAVFGAIWLPELYAVHAAAFRAGADAYPPLLRTLLELGAVVPADAYLQARRLLNPMRHAFAQQVAEFDLLMMPVVPTPAPEHTSTGDYRFQAPWSTFGFPALALPVGMDADGMPLSTQLVSSPWREDRLLNAAAWLEDLLALPVALAPVAGQRPA